MLVAVAVLVTGAVVYATGEGGTQRATGTAKARTIRSTTGETATSTAGSGTPAAGSPRYPVAETVVTVIRGPRRIPTAVRYPKAPTGDPFPLIVFSPGFDIAPDAYSALLESWAAAGFVVAEPDYPLTSPTDPRGVAESDIVNHPADLGAVVDSLLGASRTPGSPLDGVLNPSRLGLAGHSDGGDVADALVSGTCCRDARVRAAVLMSSAELSSLGGYAPVPGAALLVVQGSADTINPPSCSEQIYDAAPPPRFYLDLIGAGHHAPYLAGSYDRTPAALASDEHQVVEKATIAFWRTYLGGDPSAARELAAAGNVAGVSTMTDGAAVTRAGTCPGAPP